MRRSCGQARFGPMELGQVTTCGLCIYSNAPAYSTTHPERQRRVTVPLPLEWERNR